MNVTVVLRAIGCRLASVRLLAVGLAVLVPFLAIGLATELAAAPDASATLPGLNAKPGEQMLVEADQIVYDNDNNQVSAVGNVKIYYSGYTLEAEKVTYVKSTGRLIASGRVKMTDPSGIAIYAEQFDITDNFRDAFVQSLRVEAPERTHFAAEHAERANGETTTFFNGVYTACEPCLDHPEKPPLWQVKAGKIILNQKEKMIYFHGASIEFFGKPIAYLPYFSTPDPSVKRKSGILAPEIHYAPATGLGVTLPYFWALAPNYDLTVTPTLYSQQGLLTEIEWRHRLENGQYTLKMAGIYQLDPPAFLDDAGTHGLPAQTDWRGGIRTTGEFDINTNWSLGWDATLSSDRLFTRNYGVLNGDTSETISNVHLTGLSDRNYFDARGYYFEILTDEPSDPQYDQARQPIVAPVVDHHYIFDDPVFGGELSLTSNLTALNRGENDPFTVSGVQYYHGLAGTYIRGTTEAAWQRTVIGPGGQVITPFASLRGDIYSLNPDGTMPAGLTTDPTAYRAMPAIGFEWSWPIMATLGSTTHIFEPIAQLIARPDEQHAGQLPNDDAQSLVFDDSNLFSRDKFSGFDRVEGGTRLNAGLHYLGTFGNGLTVDSLVGQSYLLAGTNPFTPDLAGTGGFSGLETDVSDVVGRVALDNGAGSRLTARGRFDQKDLAINRGEIEEASTSEFLTSTLAYQYLRKDPLNGVAQSTSVVSGTAAVNFAENWNMFGSLAYDITKNTLASDSIGIGFNNSCLTLSVAYAETREDYTDIPKSQQLLLRLQLRTVGEGDVTADIGGLFH
jgi:LPS-assembly protein